MLVSLDSRIRADYSLRAQWVRIVAVDSLHGSWSNSMDKEERREGGNPEVARLLLRDESAEDVRVWGDHYSGGTSDSNLSRVERDGTADSDGSCTDPTGLENIGRNGGSHSSMASHCHYSYGPGCLANDDWEHCALHNMVETAGICTADLIRRER